MKNLLFVLLLWTFIHPAFSQKIFQPGKITLTNGAIISGYLFETNYDKLQKGILFKDSKKGEKRFISIDEIDELSIDKKKKYKAFNIDVNYTDVNVKSHYKNERRLLMCLEEGSINLYMSIHVDGTFLFFEKDNQPLVKLITVVQQINLTTREKIGLPDTIGIEKIDLPGYYNQNRLYISELRKATHDCGMQIKRDLPLKKDRIIGIIRSYNKCNKQKIESKSYFKNYIHFKPRLTINRHPFSNDIDNYVNSIEGHIEVYFPVSRNNFSILAAYYSAEQYEERFSNLGALITETNQLKMIGFRANYYPFPNRKIEPYLSGGITMIFNDEIITHSGTDTIFGDDTKIQRPHFAFGVDAYVWKKLFVTLEVSTPYFPNMKAGFGYKL